MNYHQPALIDALAAEYVLGTLHGRARDRFEILLRDLPAVRAAVWRWENRFGALGTQLSPVTPPAAVWQAIARRIAPTANVISMPRARFWQAWSALATAAALVLALLLVSSTPATRTDHVALFADTQAQPQWLVSLDSHSGRLTVRALNVAAAQADRDYELWMLPEGGAAPRSLGLLPAAGRAVDRQLPAALNASLRNAAGLAISLEPAGGSPTGAPTGPVLFQAPLLQL